MKRYYNIDFEAMRQVGLNATEWMICENVGFLCSIEESGYTDKTRAEFGEHHGLSTDRAKKIIKSLVDRNFLKKNKKHHLRISKEWIKVMSLNGKDIPETVQDEQKLVFPFHEDEFGEDEASSLKNRPSLNQVKVKAKELTKKEVENELLEEIAESFWLKQESVKWDKVVDFAPLLRRYIKAWLKNDKKSKPKSKPKEKKITSPSSAEEMRLFLKQMSDDNRKKFKVRRKVENPYNPDDIKEEIIVINHIGMPVVEESGEYCSTTYSNQLLEYMCKNLKKFITS